MSTTKKTPVKGTTKTAEVEVEIVSDSVDMITHTDPSPRTSLSFNATDIELPRLNVIQKMSQIEGPVGSIVIDQDAVLVEAGTPIDVIVLGATKRWKEDIPYDEDIVPQYANTQESADELAQSSSYPVIEFAEITLLIPQTEGGDESLFPYPIGDKNYVMARITVQKDAYRLTYKRMFTFHTFNPSEAISSRVWRFESELLTKGRYSWYAPTLTVTREEAPQDVVTFVEGITQSLAQQ